MPYLTYKFLHLVGIFMVILSLGGLALHAINGGMRQYVGRKFVAITHGVGLAVVLVSGFGALARLGIHDMPAWVILKIVVWLLFGAMIVVLRRKPQTAKAMWWVLLALGGFAAYLALYKPF